MDRDRRWPGAIFSSANAGNCALVAAGLFAVAWAVARASVQAVTIDEAATYEAFVAHPTPFYWYPASNNHVLNSMLIRAFTNVFGLSHLSVRAPALMGAILYIAVAGWLSKLIATDWLARIALFVLLVYNPFVFDYFVAARGYGLANALLLCAIAVAAHCFTGAAKRESLAGYCALSSVLLSLSIAANFAFAFIDAALMFNTFVLAYWLSIRDGAPRAPAATRLLCACVVPGLVASLFLTSWTLIQWPRGQLWDGAASLSETVGSVVEASLHQLNPWLANPVVYSLFDAVKPYLLPLLAAACAGRLVLLWLGPALSTETRQRLLLALFLAVSAALALAAHWLSFKLFHLLLPRNRTAIYFVPIATLGAGIAATVGGHGPRAILSRRAAVSAMLLLASYYCLCLRLTYFKEWQYLADVKTVYSVLAYYNHRYNVRDVAASWHYSSSLNFYRDLSGNETMAHFESTTDQYPVDKQAYVLFYPSDQALIDKLNLKVVYRGESTDVAVAIRRELDRHWPVSLGTYDDTDSQIDYHGTWTVDRQFRSAVNGTLTYSNSPGDRVRLGFSGTGITWAYTKAFNRGMARVSIDGIERATIDLYSPAIGWNTRASFRGLHPGEHLLEVYVLEKRNAKAADRFVDVDAITVD